MTTPRLCLYRIRLLIICLVQLFHLLYLNMRRTRLTIPHSINPCFEHLETSTIKRSARCGRHDIIHINLPLCQLATISPINGCLSMGVIGILQHACCPEECRTTELILPPPLGNQIPARPPFLSVSEGLSLKDGERYSFLSGQR